MNTFFTKIATAMGRLKRAITLTPDEALAATIKPRRDKIRGSGTRCPPRYPVSKAHSRIYGDPEAAERARAMSMQSR